MTVTAKIRPDIMAGLTAVAAEHGVTERQNVLSRIEEQVPHSLKTAVSPTERAAAWRESVKGLPQTPLLSDEAISRESIYTDRG